MSQKTLQQLRDWLTAEGLDAYLVTQPQNRSYLSGWLNDDTEGAGMLLVSRERQVLLTNPLYLETTSKEANGWEIHVLPGREYAAALIKLVGEIGAARLGFEASAVTYAEYQQYRAALGEAVELIPYAKSYLETLRLVKQPYEIELLRRAVAITDLAFAHICTWIQPDVTEKEVQWEITRKMLELGADGVAFETIVASGSNGVMPHAHPSSRRIERGELITIDMGARYKGYCADMTRTICLGEPAETRMVELYETVLLAMKTCEAGLHSNISGKSADCRSTKGPASRRVHRTM